MAVCCAPFTLGLAMTLKMSCNAPHDRCNHVHAPCIISTQLSSNNGPTATHISPIIVP